MASNTKRTRRILLMVGVLVVLLALAGGAYALRQSQRDNEALEARAAGVKALEAGDYPAALDGFERYLKRFQTKGATANDFVLYARARRHVEAKGGAHLFNAIGQLRRALAIDGTNIEARKDLLDLYDKTGYATEALDLIEILLRSEPKNVELYRIQRKMLRATRQFSKALTASLHFSELAPDELAGFLETLSLMHETGATAGEIDKWVEAVTAAHPGDPRFELLRAAALSSRRDESKAKASLDHVLAITSDVTDPDFVSALVWQLDNAGRFADSLQVLESRSNADRSELRRELVRRLWFTGRPAAIVSQADKWGAQVVRSDPEVAALHALALHAVGRAPDAAEIGRDLAARQDAEGKAWSALLEHARGDETPSAREARDAVVALAEAVKTVPNSAFHWQSLGDARSALGETDLAFESWGTAARLSPAWGRPLRNIANLLLKKSQPYRAAAVAREAVKRDPTDGTSITIFVNAVARLAGQMKSENVNELLAVVEPAAGADANEETLPVYIELLARVDRAAAERRLQKMLDSHAGASEATLLRLAQVAAGAKIQLTAKFLDLSESIHGVTPQLALSKAMWRSRESGDAVGLVVLDDMRTRSGAAPTDLNWGLVRASFLEEFRRPEAGTAWLALAEQHPEDLNAQLGALASSAAWNDQAAIGKIIERVHGLTGDEGVTWRVARARWLLDASGAAEADVAEAAKMLGEVTRAAPMSISARVLLARALETLGNLAGAEEQLRSAAEMAPDNMSITLEVARVALKQGHPDEARRQLDRALNAPKDLAPEQTERAAYLLAVQGDIRRSADLLEPLTSRSGSRRDGVLLLAQLYAKLGELDRAARLCEERLLPEPDLQIVELTSAIYAALGRSADAEATLVRLDSLALRPGDRELARGQFAARWSTPESAKTWLRSAVAKAPERSDVWTEYLSFSVRTGDAASVNAILDDPKAQDVEPVKFLRSVRELCAPAMKEPRLRILLLGALTEPGHRAVLTEALRKVSAEDRANREKYEQLAQSIRSLAEANPRVLPLQLLAAELCGETGDLRGGCTVARQAMKEFPNSAAAAQQATELLARTRVRWQETLETALAWRDRAGRLDLMPELYVAEALIWTDRAAEAMAGLEPHITAALARPEANEQILLTYAIALVRSGRASKATELLAGLAKGSDRWRALPLEVWPSRLGSAASMTAWLTACSGNVDPADLPGRVRLARAWGGAWEKYHDPGLLAGAKRVLDPLKQIPDAPMETFFISATLDQESGDFEAAKRGMSAALERRPGYPPALNNMAVILADSDHWQEAVEYASKATAASPKEAEYHDTLGQCLRKGRQYDRAEAAHQAATSLEPGNPKWPIGLAETLVEAGKTDEARRVVTRLDEFISRAAPLPETLRHRMDLLRAALR